MNASDNQKLGQHSETPKTMTAALGHEGSIRRADAHRSILAVLDAAVDCFARNPEVSMSAIADVAGVGRTTLYAHFASREELIEAAIEYAIRKSNAVLDAQPFDELPTREALLSLVHASWDIIGGYGGLISAVETSLGTERLHQHHRHPLQRIEELLRRGQREEVFRSDLPRQWLIAVFSTLMHTAVHEVDAGRLAAASAPDIVAATLLSILEPESGNGDAETHPRPST
jgi:TetR/AcrR family transcriptional regulator, mexCD-oprJ operon repressor